MVLSCAGLFIVLGPVVQSFVYLTYFMYKTIPHAGLSWYSVRLGIKGFLVQDSLLADSLCYFLEQDTLSAA